MINPKSLLPRANRVLSKVLSFGLPPPTPVSKNPVPTKFQPRPLFIREYSEKPEKPGTGSNRSGEGVTIKGVGTGLSKFGLQQEEGYFYNKDKENLDKLKKQLKEKDAPKPEKKP